jgi:hypothetical protein
MYAKNFLKVIGENKEKDSKTILNESTKGVMIGATIGAGIGLFIGFGRKQNLLLSAFVGSIIGGGVSKLFINKKQKDETK